LHRIAVIGCGYVGLVTGTCLAELGNRVVCVENDPRKLAALESGTVPFFEPGLAELVARNRERGRLRFAARVADGIAGCSIVFIAVGTPMLPSGDADLSAVRAVARGIAEGLDSPKVVVNKSTVPVETGDLVAAILREHKRAPFDVHVVSNPEFLREGSAIADFMHPDRIVLGVADAEAEALMRDLYAPLAAPIIATDVRTAEMIKYTANSFLAARVSFINEIAEICEQVGADVSDVVAGAGADRRIGTSFMSPGLGFGGSCFPKDLRALRRIAQMHGVPTAMIDAVLEVNTQQIARIAARVRSAAGGSLAGRTVALLGLAFKPQTDDVRESPALVLARALVEEGAHVVAHDPVAVEGARAALGTSVAYVADEYDAAQDADVLVIATDWNEYKQLDFGVIRARMRGDAVCDARNACDPRDVEEHGLRYFGVGRAASARRSGGARRADPSRSADRRS
jgi:UDPglucose 6-dehydrogenase